MNEQNGTNRNVPGEGTDGRNAGSVLSLHKVSYRYAKNQRAVLKGISAEFEPGKPYSIIGKSAAGKSTLLSLLSGLDVATEGEVVYQGQNVAKLDRDDYRARSVGIVFPNYNLLTNMTALENVVLSMNISRVNSKNKRNEALELLQRLGVDKETANRKVLSMSGGEQQRVGIARALAHDPDVIIADEPTGNLDRETRVNIMEILASLAHEDGKCVIVVTYSKAVSGYADEVLGLFRGVLNKVD